ncbi:hypothetical protein BK643_02535 [Pseudomonas protegens]|uniref:DUF4376 domain-containing protein n=1 Tax=Pseudomonas protegens TaxID=380021 RepID=UPI000F48C42E|nr:hypothetical protein [Pseudomonas protegens]ROM19571.1 hypothetical protein BK643_02535 [Pseudomonas protegens]
MIYGLIDAQGAIGQVCNDSTISELPAGAIELTAEQAADRWAWRIVDGVPLYAPMPGEDHCWNGREWVLDVELIARRTAEQAKLLHTEKVSKVNSACNAAIESGFWSDALGERYQYSSQLDDQLNLTGAILWGEDMPYACRDVRGVKSFHLHTTAQLRKVGDDFTAFKLQLLQRASALKQQLDLALASADLVALEAVTWESAEP